MNKNNGFYLCHRMPERTFKIGERYFPVCSRCTGVLIGSFVYLVFIYLFSFYYTINLLITAIAITIPLILDGFTQLFGFRESNNILRFFTGLLGIFGLLIIVKYTAFALVSIFHYIIN